MSEKDKQKKKASAEETAAQETVEQTAAPAEEAVQEETFTVTKSQMEQMEQLAKVLADANDKYLRLAAEYDNYRKRTTREKENVYGTAKADTIKPFLAVLDNLERGVQQFEEGDGHRQGLEMICKQFIDVLGQMGVTEIPALGQPFDPEKHNAVMHTEDESAGENTIVEFAPYADQCRFVGCSHIKEKGCRVLQAVKDGDIHPSRHRSYVRLYQELKDLKSWEKK